MAKLNTKTAAEPRYTHEGAKAVKVNPHLELRRSVMSCMLWEGEFYEDGVSIAKRIADLVPKVKPESVASLAIEARNRGKLRHVPLWLVINMAMYNTHKRFVKDTLYEVIQRPDELTEALSIYWKNGKKPIAVSIKKGLAKAFTKFNRYSLGKYNQNNDIKLKDVLFLCHAKPKDNEQAQLWKDLIDGSLEFPKDAWERALSETGADKKEVWKKLLVDKKLGALALLRNLRNMLTSNIDTSLIKEALLNMSVERVLPFRFITAARYVPKLEPELEQAMFKCLDGIEKLPGKTILVIDVSGSMSGRIGGKSELSRLDSAAALAILAREQCEECVIYTTAGNDYARIHNTKLLPARRGFALRDLVMNAAGKQGGGGIFLTQCLEYIHNQEPDGADRIIVFTDEQDCDTKLSPSKADAFGINNYLVNIASYQNGIGYGKWIHIDGFSEAVISFIYEYERQSFQ